MPLRDIAEVNFSLGKTAFRDIGKGHSNNLINAGVYEDFGGPFREKLQKGSWEPLGKQLFGNGIAPSRKSFVFLRK